MQLTDDKIELLYVSAPLHDVGKVGVRDSILLKPGKLTEVEFEEMKKHTTIGAASLRGAAAKLGNNSFLHLAQEIAFTHHEKWDGTGYPRGLSGMAIPLSGRLMAAADIYDALVTRRVYKPPFPEAKAVDIITKMRGTHLDPAVVDAFLDLREVFRGIATEFADSDEDREAVAKPPQDGEAGVA